MNKTSSIFKKPNGTSSTTPAAPWTGAIPPVNSFLTPTLVLREGGGGPAGSLGGRPGRFGAWLVLMALIAPLLGGCQSLSYVGPNGERFSRRSVGTITSISALAV